MDKRPRILHQYTLAVDKKAFVNPWGATIPAGTLVEVTKEGKGAASDRAQVVVVAGALAGAMTVAFRSELNDDVEPTQVGDF